EKVDQYVEQLRTSYATAEPANHPAQNGDLVYASFSAVDLHPEEGKDAELIKDRPIQTVVKDDTGNGDEEWPYPGFAHALAGLSEGDEKTSQYTFSDQSTYEALKGREVEFHTKVNAVKSLILPELNDEFAQNLGEFKDVAEMRGALRSNLEKSAQDEYEQEFSTHVLEHVREGASLKYPPQMLQDEIDSILKNVEQDLAGQKMDLDTYLKVRQTDREKFIEEEVKPAAIRRLERSLLVEEIAKAEKIQISNEELQSGFAETLSQLESAGDFDKVRKRVGNERMANAVAMEAASRLMNRRVLDRLKQIATGQAEAAPAEDAAPQAEPAAEVADTKAVEKEAEKPSEEGSKTDSE
ncbi:MAG TPA: trigger factor, partial [Anaerolineales bacterium]